MTAPARTLLITAVALALAGCAGEQKPSVAPAEQPHPAASSSMAASTVPSQAPAPSSPRSEPVAAPDIEVETIRSAPFGLEAAREAHRQNEQRRRLRYLEALEPGYLLRTTREALPEDRILAGAVSVRELREIGRLLFQHDYTFADGLGSGESRRRAEAGGNPFRRVHGGRFGGPETTSCTSCHWRGGLAGGGALQDASLILGDGSDVEGADPRNPPALQGVGVVEALAVEMTRELGAARARLAEDARREKTPIERKLVAKGVEFGTLRASAEGEIDAAGVQGVDPDLVVRPFGWKGTFATVREFVAESLQLHFGIQCDDLIVASRRRADPELVGSGPDGDDPDGDGVRQELTSGQLTALVTFLACEELPVVRPPETVHGLEPAAPGLPAPVAVDFTDAWSRGRELFSDIGCARCHVPALVLENARFATSSADGGRGLEIDLARELGPAGFPRSERQGGYPVWLFSDLKRHDLGPANASRHVDHGVSREQYLTRRLWGLSSSPPYFYDGHASSLDQAIESHGGEANDTRVAFQALSRLEQGALRVFLLSLTRERRLVVP